MSLDYINIKGLDNGYYQVFDLTGKVVVDQNTNEKLDVTSLNTGAYILRTQDGRTQKFLKI